MTVSSGRPFNAVAMYFFSSAFVESSNTIHPMKPLKIALVVTAAVFSCSGCQDNRVPALEERVADLEAEVRSLEQDQARVSRAKDQSQADFKACIDAANSAYDEAVRNNGTRNGRSYSVPVTLMQAIERLKQGKFEECKLLYK